MHTAIAFQKTAKLILDGQNINDETIAQLSIQNLREIEKFISEIVTEEHIPEYENKILLRVFQNGSYEFIFRTKKLTDEESDQIVQWAITNNHEIYADDYFVCELERFLFKTKKYKLNDGSKILSGEIYENTPFEKIKLQREQQRYLMKEFL